MLYRGLMVGAASGALGSMVASHNKGGQYMRARVVPVGGVASPQQQAVRNALAMLSAAWAGLTDVQRLGWGDYALNVPGTNALGDAITLSGQNWFIACNTPRLAVGLAIVENAPTEFNRGTVHFPALTIPTLNATAGVVAFGGSVAAPANLLIYQGRPYSNGRTKYYGSFRHVATVDITAGATAAVFTPAFPVGDTISKCTVQIVVSQDDGRLSSPLQATFRE